MNTLKKKFLGNKTIIKIFQGIITIILFYILFRLIDLEKVKYIIYNANIYYILIGMSLYIPGIALSSYKWKISLYNITGYKFNFLYLVKLYWIGNFISNFLPSSFGGDTYRFYKINKEIKNKKDTLNSIFFERLSGIIMLSILNILLFITYKNLLINYSNKILLLIPLIISCSILLILIFKSAIIRIIKIKKIIKILEVIKYNNNILPLLIISIIYIFTSALMIKFYLLGFGVTSISIMFLVLLVSSSNLIGMIPISLNSIGLSESIWVIYLSIIGVPIEIGIVTAITGRISLIIMTSLGGLLSFKKDKSI